MLLRIKDLTISASVGVLAHEIDRPQQIIVNMTAIYDEGDAARTDKLEDTLDYSEVENAIIRTAQEKHVQLLEHLLHRIGSALLAFPRIQEVAVEVEKPKAMRHAESVAISATFQREPLAGG